MSSRASLNHIFRTVWNQALGAMVAVAETDSSSSGSAGRRIRVAVVQRPPEVGIGILALSIALAWSVLPTVAIANPTGGVAVVGQATFTNTGNKLLVTTQNGAAGNFSAINWQSFSIPSGSTTYFQQPNAASTSINRVVTNTPTQIFGTLSSNGNLVLVNQAGIAVGTGAVVDTNGFTASSLAMSDADAMAGRLRFGDGTINASGVSVNGSVLARSGDVVLLGGSVNTGADALVQAPNGSAILAAGQQIEITGRGLEGIRLQVQAPNDSAVNLGALKGDAVGMFAGTLKHSGLVQATAATMEGGKVVLKATDLADVTGTVLAQGANDMGGTIHVSGDKIALRGSALLDASASKGGGEVLVGGGWHGEDSRIPNAQYTLVGSGAHIKADATDIGNGGQVVVWSDGATRFAGTLSARGGSAGGNGGAAEVSGKRSLDFLGSADLRAPLGSSGSLLLDPNTLTISAGPADINGDATTGDDLSSLVFTSASANSVITASAVQTQLTLGNVTLEASGDINITAPIFHNYGTSPTLTINSTGSGSINASSSIGSASTQLNVLMTASGGNISVGAISSFGGAVTLSGAGSVTMGAVSTNSGNLSATASSGSIAQSGALNIGGTSTFNAGGSITLTNASNQFGGVVSLTSSGNASIKSPGSINLGASSASGVLTIDSGGSVSGANAITASTLDVTLNGGMTLTASGNMVDTLKIKNNNPSTSSVNYFNSGALTLGPIDTLGDVNISTGTGTSLTQSGAIKVGGNAYLSAGQYAGYGSLVLMNAGNNLANVNLKGSQVSIQDTNALTINSVYSDGAVLIQTAGGLTLSGSIRTAAAGDAVKLVSGGALNGGSGSIYLDTSGARWLAYLGSPGADSFPTAYDSSFNQLPIGFKQYNASNGSSILGSGNGVIYSSSPSVSAALGGAASKIYDGSTSMPIDSLSIGSVTGSDNMTSASATIVSADASDANVGTGKLVTVSGTLSGIVTGASDPIGAGKPVYGYQFSTSGNVGTITPAAVTLNLSGSRVYDGTNVVNASIFSLSGLKAGETLTLTGAGTVADRNVGIDKPVTLGTLTLGNATGTGTGLASNYTLVGGKHVATITVRPLSTWIGTTGGAWSDPTKWDALPDGNNVLAVSIPAGISVSFDNSLGDLKLNSLGGGGSLVLGGGNLSVNSGLSLTNYTQSNGTLSITGALSVSGVYTQTGGGLTVSGPVSAAQYSHTAGSLTGNSTLVVSSGFQQSGGSIAMGGAVTVTQTTGDLQVGSMNAPAVSLTANAGSIGQSGPLVVSGLLSARSATGTVLNNSGNKVGAFQGSNTGIGGIAFTSVGAMDVQGANTANGDITITNFGGITTTGVVTANGSLTMTANSPLVIGSAGATATGNIKLVTTNLTSPGNLTLNGDVNSSAGSVAITAAGNYAQNGTVRGAQGVSASAGGEMTFGPNALTFGNPVSFTANGIPVIAPGTAPQGSAPIDFVSTFMDKFDQALVAQNVAALDPADPKKDKDQVVVEGQSCTR